MKTSGSHRVQIVPLCAWVPLARGPKPFRLSPQLRNFTPSRAKAFVRLTNTGGPRARLLWSAEAGENIIAAFASYDTDDWSGDVLLIGAGVIERQCYLPQDLSKSAAWHRARLVETAKAAVAVLREQHAPAVESEAAAWLRRQLGQLNA